MDVMDLVNKSENTSAVIVKTKILGLKEELDRVKEMCASSRNELEKEKIKKSDTEIEVLALREKVKSMEDQCNEMNNRVQEATDKLMGVTKFADECERARRALDHRKNMDMDRTATLEEMYKETKSLLFESERKYEEVSKKLMLTKADGERAESRIQKAEHNAKNIKDEMKALTAKLKGFQLQLEEYGDREERYDQTIERLNAQIKNANLHNDNVSAQIEKLQMDIQYLHDEINQATKANKL